MPGTGRRFSEKQDRMAKHVAASEESRGMDPKKALSIGYATVNARKGKKKSTWRGKLKTALKGSQR